MSTAVEKASKAMKGMTSTVGQHRDACDRANEIFVQTVKRAQADYFERIRKATEIITGGNGETSATTSETTQAAAGAAAPAS